MNTSRLLIASLLLSLTIVLGCVASKPPQLVETKPKSFKELVAESTPPSLDQIEVEPNPLTLVVDIDLAGKITLNHESVGTTDNTRPLVKRLKRIFAEREHNRAYEPGSDKIAKSVFVKAPRSARYVMVVKVIDAIKAAGGNPIGLQIDDLTEGQR